jgi:hypothetical protein
MILYQSHSLTVVKQWGMLLQEYSVVTNFNMVLHWFETSVAHVQIPDDGGSTHL